MLVVAMRVRIIQSGDQYSFQINDEITDLLLWTCPTWYESEETAKEASRAIKANVLKQLNRTGMIVICDFEGSDYLFQANNGNVAVVAVLAINNKTGKYGFALMTADGQMILKPKIYYDTPEEAQDAASEKQDEFATRCAAAEGIKVMMIPPDSKDFDFEKLKEQMIAPKDDMKAAIPLMVAPIQLNRKQATQNAKQKSIMGLRGFDTTIN